MNEITNIHLGRQPFAIAVDAHHALRAYLKDISEQVDDNADVMEEIELRIAELFSDRGISDKKVAIMADVTYVKEQLGEPADFQDEEKIRRHEGRANGHTKIHRPREADGATRRLYRDTDNATLAGVCAGLASFFGIDAIIVRLIFVAFTLLGGSGILIYILLWILVPPAKTNSDRLQMQGKPVTVENIKEAVNRADVQGAANRLVRLCERLFRVAGKLLLGLVGLAFIIAGIGLLLGATTATSFAVVHGLQLGGQALFPVNSKEYVALFGTLAVVLVLAILAVLAGRAMIRRKWGVPGWVLASLVAIFIAGGSIGAATIADSVEPVRARIDNVSHSRWIKVGAFSRVNLVPGSSMYGVSYSMVTDGRVGVEIRSFGKSDNKKITTQIKDGVLTIDATTLNGIKRCVMLCPYGPTNVEVRVHMPPEGDMRITDDESTMIIPGYLDR